jgi:hypothetical protein
MRGLVSSVQANSFRSPGWAAMSLTIPSPSSRRGGGGGAVGGLLEIVGNPLLGFVGAAGGGEVEAVGDHFLDRPVESGHGVAVPGDAAFPVDDEGMGDAVLAEGLHVGLAGALVLVERDHVVHLGALLLDEGPDLALQFVADPDDGDALVLEPFLEGGEVGDADSAGGGTRWPRTRPR